MKKKIGLFITKGIWGGASRYVFDLASTLDQSVFDVFVVCGQEGELSARLEDMGIKVYKISSMQRDIKISKEIKTLRLMYNILKKERPDAVHLNSPKAAGLGALCGRILGIKKIIYTVHGFTFNEDRNVLQKTAIKFFTWLTILLSTKTIVLSQTEYQQVVNWPFIKNRLSVIYLAIKDLQIKSKEESLALIDSKLPSPLPRDSFIVGTIAELHKNKGYPYAIEALSNMRNVSYVIISDGEEKSALLKQINASGSKNIHLTGRIENAASFLNAFDLFLLPSVKEGFPYTLLEAGLAEIPIIATDVGGIKELITQKTGILIHPKKPEEIYLAVQNIRKNPLKSKSFSDNLKRHIEQEHNFEHMLSKLQDMYMD